MFRIERDDDEPLFFRISAGLFEAMTSEELHDDLDQTAKKIHAGELSEADLPEWTYFLLFPQDEASRAIHHPIPVRLDHREVDPRVVRVHVLYHSVPVLGQEVYMHNENAPLYFEIYPEGPRKHTDIIAENPELGVRAIERSYDLHDSLATVLLHNTWDVLVGAVGYTEAGRLVKETLGDEKGTKILAAIKGQ